MQLIVCYWCGNTGKPDGRGARSEAIDTRWDVAGKRRTCVELVEATTVAKLDGKAGLIVILKVICQYLHCGLVTVFGKTALCFAW